MALLSPAGMQIRGTRRQCFLGGAGARALPQTVNGTVPPGAGRSGPALGSAVREGQCEVVVVTAHGATGQAADGESALKRQLVHCKCVGVDQPPVSGGSTRRQQVRATLPTLTLTLVTSVCAESPGPDTPCAEGQPWRRPQEGASSNKDPGAGP